MTKFLTTETFEFVGVNIYSSAVVIILIFLFFWLLIHNKKITFTDKKMFSAAFLSLSIFTLLIAAYYTITGTFLFSDSAGSSLRIYMFIAAVGIFVYIRSGIKEDLLKKE